MSEISTGPRRTTADSSWLAGYYAVRAGVSLAWVVAALTVGPMSPLVSGVLLIGYPVWDAVANIADARRAEGLRASPTQAVNALISGVTALAVGVALTHGMHTVLAVFGAWAVLAGILQLATALRRRRRAGSQWVMMLSGAQSAAAGAMFLAEAGGQATPTVADIAPYAAFGAFYFLVSAGWLAVSLRRRR
ncbi:DUF308 domain-containing protein [Mycolicibacterium sp. 018/SC-01/001]|uniref:DUF308 domain-containing protein n=1 Tax=Mycolicibacterium sp. 018/SC-01/001 TaxID=2592069 RepID=UPI00117EB3CE|nr:DUF308 domain-containing protein [Mycolicibacterium sp. 018/SC-01/001]TRW81804.1 DUF308 domain-containing protein [Mycolicibacterium sp. 018/SC-01/001]